VPAYRRRPGTRGSLAQSPVSRFGADFPVSDTNRLNLGRPGSVEHVHLSPHEVHRHLQQVSGFDVVAGTSERKRLWTERTWGRLRTNR